MPVFALRRCIAAVLFAIVLFVVTTPALAQTCAPRPNGMVAWWRLNESSGTTVSDTIGSHTGTAFSVPAPAAIGSGAAALASIIANTWTGGPVSTAGKVGNSLQFGFNIYVEVPNAATLNFGTGNFSIDAWIKLHSYNAALGKSILAKHHASGGYVLRIIPNSSNQNVLQLLISDGTNGGYLVYNGPVITAPLGTWIFVAAVRSGKTVTIYANNTGGALNNISVTHSASPLPIASSTNPLWIGMSSAGDSHLAIDEVELFNRALTAAEVQSIFNAGSAGKCGPAKGMTWIHSASNAQTGTVTVGCSGCDAYQGDTACAQPRPLLCIYKPTPAFPVPAGVNNTSQYSKWSGGVIATTAPVAGSTFAHSTDASAHCAAQFGAGWRVAEFHDGWGWNFQAYGGTVSAPAVPSTRFWVHNNDQPGATCWAP